ncbi:DUF805 domain-containing protein [Labrenzia sp. VG12]|uniref:DUF805 domain-containing protein n=1 Tax=Labrenzia sp. VG12 TaxID=2021862 RepID=UPI0012FD70DA|nr:DUF805 domain-containing protein [Labrenzia sp. VG12]
MSTPPRDANIAPGPVWALLSPLGRMGREPYWLCFAFILVLTGIVINYWFSPMLDAFSASLGSQAVAPDTLDPEALRLEIAMNAEQLQSNPMFAITFFVLELLPLGMLIKRLHDIGHSGFFALLIFVPVLGFIMLIFLGFAPSQAQPNRHGPLPNSFWR